MTSRPQIPIDVKKFSFTNLIYTYLHLHTFLKYTCFYFYIHFYTFIYIFHFHRGSLNFRSTIKLTSNCAR